MRETITSEDAPSLEEFPFSQAVEHGDTLYLSGQAPLDPESGELLTETIEQQTRRTMRNIELVLDAADASFDDVLKATVFLTDMDDFEAFNETYREHFDEPYPARSAVEVSDLAGDFDVEIEIIAAI